MSCRRQVHSEIALTGHSSTHAPHSTHLSASMTAIWSIVIAPCGHISAQEPHPTQSSALTVGNLYTSHRQSATRIKVLFPERLWETGVRRLKGLCKGFGSRGIRLLGDCSGGALVDTSAAVDTLGCVDDCDVVNGDCALGACIFACTACDTLICVYCRHFETSADSSGLPYLIVIM